MLLAGFVIGLRDSVAARLVAGLPGAPGLRVPGFPPVLLVPKLLAGRGAPGLVPRLGLFAITGRLGTVAGFAMGFKLGLVAARLGRLPA